MKPALQEIVVSLLAGVTLTLLSVLYSRPILTDIIGFVGVTMKGYGFPLFWLKETRVIYPGARPEFTLLYDAFITDFIFWFLTSLVVIFMFKWIESRGSVGKPSLPKHA